MFGDIADWGDDTDFVSYLVNRSVSGEYRESERAVDFDVFKTVAKTNTTRRENDKKGTNDSAIWKEYRQIREYV